MRRHQKDNDHTMLTNREIDLRFMAAGLDSPINGLTKEGSLTYVRDGFGRRCESGGRG